jgi:hypothetical protein
MGLPCIGFRNRRIASAENRGNRVKAELAAAYRLLIESLPLSRQTLVTGGIDWRDQEAFWNAYRLVDEFVHLDPDEWDDEGSLLRRTEQLEVEDGAGTL